MGIEKALVISFVGFKKIHLVNIKQSNALFLEINEEKVLAIASSMASRFDPSLAVLTVMEDVEKGDGTCIVVHCPWRDCWL